MIIATVSTLPPLTVQNLHDLYIPFTWERYLLICVAMNGRKRDNAADAAPLQLGTFGTAHDKDLPVHPRIRHFFVENDHVNFKWRR